MLQRLRTQRCWLLVSSGGPTSGRDTIELLPAVFDRPYAAALVVTLLLASAPAYSTAPVAVRGLFQVLQVAVVIRLTRPVIDPRLVAELYVVAGLFALDNIRQAFSSAPALEQAILVLEMCVGVAAARPVMASARAADRRKVRIPCILARGGFGDAREKDIQEPGHAAEGDRPTTPRRRLLRRLPQRRRDRLEAGGDQHAGREAEGGTGEDSRPGTCRERRRGSDPLGAQSAEVVRAVLDANTVISALLFSGTASRLVSLWQSRRVALLVSREILEEYLRVLAYPKFKLSDQEIRLLVEEELLPFVQTVRVRRRLAVVRRDPDDDKFLECAVAGRAAYLVTGDRDLRELDSFRGITILAVGEFLEQMNR